MNYDNLKMEKFSCPVKSTSVEIYERLNETYLERTRFGKFGKAINCADKNVTELK